MHDDEARLPAGGWENRDGDGDVGAVLELLADDLESVVVDTLADCSPVSAREFTARVIDADLAVASSSWSDTGTFGQSAAFLVLATWILSALHVEPAASVRAAIGWVGKSLGPECAEAAFRATAVVGASVDNLERCVADQLGDDLLPALLWLATGLVAECGDGDPRWLRRHAGDVQ